MGAIHSAPLNGKKQDQQPKNEPLHYDPVTDAVIGS